MTMMRGAAAMLIPVYYLLNFTAAVTVHNIMTNPESNVAINAMESLLFGKTW
jgi:hypothetical protein